MEFNLFFKFKFVTAHLSVSSLKKKTVIMMKLDADIICIYIYISQRFLCHGLRPKTKHILTYNPQRGD